MLTIPSSSLTPAMDLYSLWDVSGRAVSLLLLMRQRKVMPGASANKNSVLVFMRARYELVIKQRNSWNSRHPFLIVFYWLFQLDDSQVFI